MTQNIAHGQKFLFLRPVSCHGTDAIILPHNLFTQQGKESLTKTQYRRVLWAGICLLSLILKERQTTSYMEQKNPIDSRPFKCIPIVFSSVCFFTELLHSTVRATPTEELISRNVTEHVIAGLNFREDLLSRRQATLWSPLFRFDYHTRRKTSFLGQRGCIFSGNQLIHTKGSFY